jgi:hypothetical protein
MEANKKFSYKAKLAKLEEIQGALSTIRVFLGELNENEARADEPNHGDFYGIAVHLSALEKDVDSLRHEVEPMAFFEKKSA